MTAVVSFFHGKSYRANLQVPIDISMPLKNQTDQPNCFYAPLFEASPVRAGNFTGSTALGGGVNFFNLRINPHGNGTHTECVGHIARPADFGTGDEFVFTINQCLKKFHFVAKLVTVYPAKQTNDDRVVTLEQIQEILQPGEAEALVIRTMPNDPQKLRTIYSGTNPPYLDPLAVEYMVEAGIQHLLLDLPSVDREEDGGRLLAHRAFWKYRPPFPSRPEDFERKNCTITELIFVTNEIQDGLYLLNLQIASLETDASPSKPVLFQMVNDE